MLPNELSEWLGLWDSVPWVEIDVIWACRAHGAAKCSSRASVLTQSLYRMATEHWEATFEEKKENTWNQRPPMNEKWRRNLKGVMKRLILSFQVNSLSRARISLSFHHSRSGLVPAVWIEVDVLQINITKRTDYIWMLHQRAAGFFFCLFFLMTAKHYCQKWEVISKSHAV